ncbi:MAG: type II toxin-antitoxin system VapC family toxin [Armatimonadetes bacterium]|nr:type II toxin-antitoxin system VapC family toxin [Armatimonadota bacterium]
MRVLVDTSAYYALSDRDDAQHETAVRLYETLLTESHELWATSYVVHEAASLIQARLGLRALNRLRTSIAEATTVVWVSEAVHEAAWDELERVGRRGVSPTDCASAVIAGGLASATSSPSTPTSPSGACRQSGSPGRGQQPRTCARSTPSVRPGLARLASVPQSPQVLPVVLRGFGHVD